MKYHKLIDDSVKFEHEKMTIDNLAGVLGYQHMESAKAHRSVSLFTKVSECYLSTESTPKRPGILKKRKDSPTVSSVTFDTNDPNIIRFLQDKTGITHVLTKYPVTTNPSGRKRTLCRKCVWCKAHDKRNDVGTYCLTCGEDYPLCDDPKEDGSRNCFQAHVDSFRKKSCRLQDDRRKMTTLKTVKSSGFDLRSRCVKKKYPTSASTRLAVEIESESSVEDNIVSPRKLSLRSNASGGTFRR